MTTETKANQIKSLMQQVIVLAAKRAESILKESIVEESILEENG